MCPCYSSGMTIKSVVKVKYRPCEACLLSSTADTSVLELPISSTVLVVGLCIFWFSHTDKGLLLLDEAPAVNNRILFNTFCHNIRAQL